MRKLATRAMLKRAILNIATNHPQHLDFAMFDELVKDFQNFATLPQWYAALGELVKEGKVVMPKGKIKLAKPQR